MVELPREESIEETDFAVEPDLLLDEMAAEPLDLPVTVTMPEAQDTEKLEVQVQNARRRAAAGERLLKAGVLAKVEVEARALKLLKLEAELELARLARLRDDVAAQKARLARGEVAPMAVESAELALAQAETNAQDAAEKRRAAELEIAQMNVRRQKKLIAAGIGRKIDLKRAEEKLAALRQQEEVPGNPERARQ